MADYRKFVELDLAKQRHEYNAYLGMGIPVNADHAEYLRTQRESQEAHYRVAGAGRSSERLLEAEDWERERGPTAPPQAISRCQNTPQRDRKGRLLKDNEWPILLSFDRGPHRAQFEGRVLLDTGADDNWIALDIVQEYKIPYDEDSNHEMFADFNGRPVQSIGTVTGNWIYKHSYIPVRFRIAEDPPFQTLFGCRHLLQHRILKFQGVPVAPLVAGKMTREEKSKIRDKHAQVQHEADEVERYRAWKQSMQAQGWQWSTTKNAFYRRGEAGERVWLQGGYQLNRDLRDHTQPNWNTGQ